MASTATTLERALLTEGRARVVQARFVKLQARAIAVQTPASPLLASALELCRVGSAVLASVASMLAAIIRNTSAIKGITPTATGEAFAPVDPCLGHIDGLLGDLELGLTRYEAELGGWLWLASSGQKPH